MDGERCGYLMANILNLFLNHVNQIKPGNLEHPGPTSAEHHSSRWLTTVSHPG